MLFLKVLQQARPDASHIGACGAGAWLLCVKSGWLHR